MTKNESITFEEAMSQLETAVSEMENGDLGLDELLAKFETGISLLRCCEKKLAEAEGKIEVLSQKAIAKGVEPNLDEALAAAEEPEAEATQEAKDSPAKNNFEGSLF